MRPLGSLEISRIHPLPNRLPALLRMHPVSFFSDSTPMEMPATFDNAIGVTPDEVARFQDALYRYANSRPKRSATVTLIALGHLASAEEGRVR
jgi:hypothetical protein